MGREERASGPHEVRPVGILVLVALLFLALAWVGNVAAGARAREDEGLTRGAFLDRTGRPLAETVAGPNGPRTAYLLPDGPELAGYLGPNGRWRGPEARENAVLSSRGRGAEWTRLPAHLLGRSTRGNNVRLTIDAAVQRAAAAALGERQGGIVALDPRNGDVLALAANPHCSAAQLAVPPGYDACRRHAALPEQDPALDRLFAPGSTFKTVTLTAALDTGRFGLDDLFSGADVFGPSPYFDNAEYPSNITRTDLSAITLKQALAFSDNFTFAHIGLTLGGKTLGRYITRYGFGRRTPFPWPVAISTVNGGKPLTSPYQIAPASFGGPIDHVTVMQMALIAATVADGGILPVPRLMLDAETPGGRVLERFPARHRGRVMSRSTAEQVTRAMRFVVDLGSGTYARIHGIGVAGKTGTAAGSGAKPDAWFICFAPVLHPRIAVAVLVENSGEGADFAAPRAKKVLLAALRPAR